MKYRIGQILVILSVSLVFLAYTSFVPTSLNSDRIAGYVKNHFVREVIFGIALTVWSIVLTLLPIEQIRISRLWIFGSIVVFPFWIAVAFGWSVQGLEEVWGSSIDASTAFALHSVQVGLFLLGMIVLSLAKKSFIKSAQNISI